MWPTRVLNSHIRAFDLWVFESQLLEGGEKGYIEEYSIGVVQGDTGSLD